jgi:hypothetical protein
MVVLAAVAKAVLAKTTGLDPVNGCRQRKKIVTNSAVIMAEISLQALILHQYQRSK